MSELNFDISETVDVLLGGKHYTIQEQGRLQLQRILTYVTGEIAEETAKVAKDKKEPSLTDILFNNFDAALPAIAMIFGYEKLDDADGKEVLQHLKTYLRPSSAIKIYEEWWRINSCDEFFVRGGRPLLMRAVVESIKANETKVAETN